MKVVVTGGAGFIGSHLVDALIENGEEVVVIDNLSSGKKENVNEKAKFYEVDLLDDKLYEIFEKENPEIVFHLAAQVNIRKSVSDVIFDANNNIIASLKLLELSRKFNVKKFIFSSSGGAIYGDAEEIPTSENYDKNPESPYGCAKLAIEKYLNFYFKNYGLNYSCLRYSNVYGKRQDPNGEVGVIAVFFRDMINGKNPVIFGDGSKTRDFVYVEDVVNANLLAMNDERNTAYNVGTGKETSILEIFNKINSLFDNKFKAIFEDDKKGEQLRSFLNIRKIKNNLSWVPEVSLDEGLKRVFEWHES